MAIFAVFRDNSNLTPIMNKLVNAAFAREGSILPCRHLMRMRRYGSIQDAFSLRVRGASRAARTD